MALTFDAADLGILRLLQQDGDTSLQDVADSCELSVPTVQRRLRRLRDAGAIVGKVVVLGQEALGFAMTFVVMVELERERLDQLDAFRRRVLCEPHVQQSYYITGEADFALICVARDLAEFEALTQRLFFADDNVRRFRTSVVLSRVKTGQALPID
ncbi:Lrp/AsnC family transcriptional regulator [Sphingomonas panacisoli]|uniref:Lrp/AsnC family transcriptional regulator n=1 Tax=Sphingomonas panacisoli TaxID=1813879 RepID=A0A5B8LF98_9SPHN|nr:Lrp/AsnC family transcriptional regulator [Sphingomonas panacisoli]QDZ06539.1 Lrp/AsnC family transcriptional regulator [Sphingomonas panacisoli]